MKVSSSKVFSEGVALKRLKKLITEKGDFDRVVFFRVKSVKDGKVDKKVE